MTTLIIIGSILASITIGLLIFMFTIKFDEQHNAIEKSLHARVYNFLSATEELPKTICSYFWNYLLVILSLPLTFPLLIVNKFRPLKFNNNKETVLISIALWWTMFIITFMIIKLVTGAIPIIQFLIYLGITVGFAIVFVLITIALILLIDYVQNKWFDKPSNKKPKEVKEYKQSMLVKRITDWKNRNCSIINWN